MANKSKISQFCDIEQAHIKKDDVSKPQKFQIFSLDAISVPEISELKNTLAPWLISIQKRCSSESKEFDENSSSNAEFHNVTESAPETIERSTQCDNNQNCKNFVDNNSQTEVPNITLRKSVQCTISRTTKYTQTNTLSVTLSETQCSVLNDKKITNNCKDFETQTDVNSCEKSTQCKENFEDHYRETDYKCSLTDIKQESQSSHSVHPSPSKCLRLGLSPVRNNVFTHIPSLLSPTSLIASQKSEKVIICQLCKQILYSKEDYDLHKKSHMICNFCKRKFTSMKRTTRHIENECKIKTSMEQGPVVELVKLEMLSIVQEKYSKYVEDLKNFQSSTKVRMRSRSTSSVDSIYSCCSFCRNPLSLLHGLKLGVDKTVQTDVLFENGLELLTSVVKRNSVDKCRIRKAERPSSSPKRMKLSKSFTK